MIPQSKAGCMTVLQKGRPPSRRRLEEEGDCKLYVGFTSDMNLHT